MYKGELCVEFRFRVFVVPTCWGHLSSTELREGAVLPACLSSAKPLSREEISRIRGASFSRIEYSRGLIVP